MCASQYTPFDASGQGWASPVISLDLVNDLVYTIVSQFSPYQEVIECYRW
jgi:hypothetical protein